MHQFTVDEITALPAADAIQDHDAGEEAEPGFQAGLVALAQRCGACGQTMPTPTAGSL